MGKGVFSKIKGIFYNVEDEVVKEETAGEDKETPAQQQPTQAVSQAPPLKESRLNADEKEVDEIYQKLVLSVIDSQSLFAQFKKVTESVFETLKDKAAGYKAAFAAISGITNATVDELLGSMDSCLSRLAMEEQDFQAQVKEHNKKIDYLKGQLADIDKQIAKLEGERKKLNTEILEEVNKTEKTEISFNQAKKRLERELNEERLRIVTFLQRGKQK